MCCYLFIVPFCMPAFLALGYVHIYELEMNCQNRGKHIDFIDTGNICTNSAVCIIKNKNSLYKNGHNYNKWMIFLDLELGQVPAIITTSQYVLSVVVGVRHVQPSVMRCVLGLHFYVFSKLQSTVQTINVHQSAWVLLLLCHNDGYQGCVDIYGVEGRFAYSPWKL